MFKDFICLSYLLLVPFIHVQGNKWGENQDGGIYVSRKSRFIRCRENWAVNRGLKLDLTDYPLPLLLKKFLVKNHASNIKDNMVNG